MVSFSQKFLFIESSIKLKFSVLFSKSFPGAQFFTVKKSTKYIVKVRGQSVP